MENRRIKMTVLVVLVGLAILLLFSLIMRRQDIEPPTEEPDTIVEQKEEPDMVASEPGPVLDSPILHGEYAEELSNALKSRGGVVSRHYEGTHTLVYPYEGRHPAIPMVEFRFRKRNAGGDLEKVYVTLVRTHRRIGDVTMDIRRPSGDIHFEGGVDVTGVDQENVHSFRIAAGPHGVGRRTIAFGQRYHMIFRVIDPDKESRSDFEEYECIVKIPDNIPEGKMAVIYVFAEIPLGTIPLSPKEEDVEEVRGEIIGVITETIPQTDAEWRVAYNHPEDGGRITRIDQDGRFRFRDRKLGGRLHIAQMGERGVTWMVVNEVRKRELILPEDADRVINRGDIYKATIAIPQEHISDHFVGLWLTENPSDLAPLASAAIRDGSPEYKRFETTGEIKMDVAPGRYWVKAFYDPGIVEERKWVTLGQIIVPDEPTGEVIQVQTEEE